MRKTKKFYRDEINASYDRACKVISEALIKYSPKRTYNIGGGKKSSTQKYYTKVSNNWNGDIEGFYVSNNRPKKIYVELYVQGEDTDSSDSVLLEDFIKTGSAKASFVEGYYNTDYKQEITAHFDSKMLYEAMKNFAKECL